jgi:hypothetical protein
MNFETLQQNLVDILGAAAAGRFRVAGYQPKSTDAVEYLNDKRLVSVFFSESQIPDNMGSLQGPVHFEAIYRLEMFASAEAKGDLSVIDNPSSTPAELTTAIANIKLAENLADTSWNELAGIVYQILMDGRNRDLGLPVGIAASRWLNNLRKDRPADISIARGILGGKYVTITGSIDLNCVLEEPIIGDTGVAGNIYDNVIDIADDDNERTGVQVNE